MSGNKKQNHKTYRTNIRVNQRGVGRVDIEGVGESIEIPKASIHTAFHGDLVEVELQPKRNGKYMAEVLGVLSRSKKRFVGLVDKDESGRCYVIPDDKRVYVDFIIDRHESKSLKNGQKVLIEMHSWKDPRKNPKGKVLSTIGKKGVHETEMNAILLESGFDAEFPGEVINEAKKIQKEFPHSLSLELKKRRDFRNITTITIDPTTAKDFDDALSVRKIGPDKYEVGIHIADVSFYVKPGTKIDNEAKERATSVYLVDRTIPMLPEQLSNDICSLIPGVERLAYSTVVEITTKGKILKKWFGRTVIKSDKRFAYREAQRVLDEKKGPFYSELKILRDISRKLKDERIKSGSILFDREEVQIEINKNGKPINISVKERMETQSVIEEWMLVANRCVAESMSEAVKSNDFAGFAYRIHERPDRSHVIDLTAFIKNLGYHLKHKKGVIKGADLNQLFETIHGTNVEDVIKQAALRTMSKATYTTKNVGHFGLAFGNYTHFTSPIRRYPDIIVHRLLCKKLKGKSVSKKEIREYEKVLEHSSQKEREAERAERESIKYKQAEYMKDKIGQEFEGIITGVTPWGLYIEENKTKANGLVKIGSLGDDYFELDEKNYQLIGVKTGEKYRLGDKVKFRLVNVNVEERNLDYELI